MICRDGGLDAVNVGLLRVALSIAREQHNNRSSSARAIKVIVVPRFMVFLFINGYRSFSSLPRKREPRRGKSPRLPPVHTRDAMGRAARTRHHRRWKQPTGCPMQQPNDLSRSLAALDQDNTLIAVIEMSRSTWLVAGIVPGINRQPLKKLAAYETALLQLLYRWRDEATKAGRTIDRIAVAYEAGRDGFWLARWLRGRGIEAYVIHPTSVAVSREHRRAKTDRLDTEL